MLQAVQLVVITFFYNPLQYDDAPVVVQQARSASADLLPDQLPPDVWVFVCDNGRDNEVDPLVNRLRGQQFRYLGGFVHLLADDQVQ